MAQKSPGVSLLKHDPPAKEAFERDNPASLQRTVLPALLVPDD